MRTPANPIYAEIAAERRRAHRKHRDNSMEVMGAYNTDRLAVLVEEVGEVAQALNDARHGGVLRPSADLARDLRAELIQVAATAAAWADAIDTPQRHRQPVQCSGGRGHIGESLPDGSVWCATCELPS